MSKRTSNIERELDNMQLEKDMTEKPEEEVIQELIEEYKTQIDAGNITPDTISELQELLNYQEYLL